MFDILSLLLSLIIIFLCFLIGLVALSFVSRYFRFTELERFFSSIVIGILFFTWLVFLVSLAFDNLSSGLTVSLFLSLIFLFVYHSRLIQSIKFDIKKISKTSFVVLALIFLFSFFIVSASVLGTREDGIHIGLNAYGDMALHLSIVNSFSLADNFPPQYSVYSGKRLGYPFLFDFFSSILVETGVSLRASVLVPTIIVMLCLFSLFYCLALRFSSAENKNNKKNKKRAAVFAILFLAFSGGLGFIYFLKESPLSVNAILKNNVDYTHNPELGLFLMNFTNNLIPQRTILFGIALGLIILIGLVSYVNKIEKYKNEDKGETKKSSKLLVFIGILTGLLPLFHAHIYVSLMIFSAVLFLLFSWESLKELKNLKREIYKLAYFFIPAILLVLPQALWMKSQIAENFLSIRLGWMLEKLSLLGFAKFWLMNLGIMLLLLIAGFAVCGKKQRKIALAFLSLFIVANIIQFQPWSFDNHKIFMFWLLGSVLIMAEFAEWLYNKKILKYCLILIIPIAIFSGLLTLTFIINNNPLLYTSEDVYIAKLISENTEKHGVFLTSDKHNHPVPMLAGRTIFEGYRGWLWTHGFSYADRDKIKKAIYEATDKEKACTLLNENSINYIFIGESERASELFELNKENELFFENNFEKVLEYKDSKLFKVECS